MVEPGHESAKNLASLASAPKLGGGRTSLAGMPGDSRSPAGAWRPSVSGDIDSNGEKVVYINQSSLASGNIAEKAAAIFRCYDEGNRNVLDHENMMSALAELGVLDGLTQKKLSEILSIGSDLAAKNRLYSLQEFITFYERLAHYQARAARQERIKALSKNPGAAEGTEQNEMLKRVFVNYCKYSVGQGRLTFDEADPKMSSTQFVKLCQDMGLVQPNGPLNVVTIDMIFHKCKPQGGRRMQFEQYLKALSGAMDESRMHVFELIGVLGSQIKPNEASFVAPQPVMYRQETRAVGAKIAAPVAYRDEDDGDSEDERRLNQNLPLRRRTRASDAASSTIEINSSDIDMDDDQVGEMQGPASKGHSLNSPSGSGGGAFGGGGGPRLSSVQSFNSGLRTSNPGNALASRRVGASESGGPLEGQVPQRMSNSGAAPPLAAGGMRTSSARFRLTPATSDGGAQSPGALTSPPGVNPLMRPNTSDNGLRPSLAREMGARPSPLVAASLPGEPKSPAVVSPPAKQAFMAEERAETPGVGARGLLAARGSNNSFRGPGGPQVPPDAPPWAAALAGRMSELERQLRAVADENRQLKEQVRSPSGSGAAGSQGSLEQRVSACEGREVALEASVKELQSRNASLEAEVKALKGSRGGGGSSSGDGAAPGPPPRAEGANVAMDNLFERVAALEKAHAESRASISALEARPGGPGAGGGAPGGGGGARDGSVRRATNDDSTLADVNMRLSSLESKQRELSSSLTATAALTAVLPALEAAMNTRLPELESHLRANDTATKALAKRLPDLESGLSSTASRLSDVDAAIKAGDKRSGAAEAKVVATERAVKDLMDMIKALQGEFDNFSANAAIAAQSRQKPSSTSSAPDSTVMSLLMASEEKAAKAVAALREELGRGLGEMDGLKDKYDHSLELIQVNFEAIHGRVSLLENPDGGSKISAFARITDLKELENHILDRMSRQAEVCDKLQRSINQVVADMEKFAVTHNSSEERSARSLATLASMQPMRAGVPPEALMLLEQKLDTKNTMLEQKFEARIAVVVKEVEGRMVTAEALRQASDKSRANDEVILQAIKEVDRRLHEKMEVKEQVMMRIVRQVDYLQNAMKTLAEGGGGSSSLQVPSSARGLRSTPSGLSAAAVPVNASMGGGTSGDLNSPQVPPSSARLLRHIPSSISSAGPLPSSAPGSGVPLPQPPSQQLTSPTGPAPHRMQRQSDAGGTITGGGSGGGAGPPASAIGNDALAALLAGNFKKL